VTAIPPLPASFVDEVAALVRERTGLVTGPARRAAFERSLLEAMRATRRAMDPVLYLADLLVTPALMDDLAARCTVGETYFFRDPEQLKLVEQRILPSLAGGPQESRLIRIWSAGCATGEEPYTLAILASRLGLAQRTRILATDISRPALSRARSGHFSRWSLRAMDADSVAAYFAPAQEGWDLRPDFRKSVEFRYLNLVDGSYPSPASGIWGMDLVLCRNVLIYFDRDTVARVAAQLIRSLSADGWLVLGPSDPLIAELVPCEVVATDAGLAYRPCGTPPTPATGARWLAPAIEPLPTPGDEVPWFGSESWHAGRAPEAPAPVERAAFFVPVAAAEIGGPAAEEAAASVERYAVRDYEGAALLAERALAREGGDPGLWALLVRAYANSGKRADAERTCGAALERCPAASELHALQALLLNAARQHEAAVTAARRALYLDRGLAVAHLAHGAALAGLRDAPGARRAFRAAAKLLDALPADAVVPASDGEPAGRLAGLAHVELSLLEQAPA
jgi:chemotaxis protein methyltransferase CheR